MKKTDIYMDGEPLIEESKGWRHRLWVAFKVLLLILLIGIISVIAFAWYNLAKLSVNPLDFRSLARTNGRTNILVLGVGDPGHSGQNLSDTMMVISLDNTNHQVAYLSIPRDLRVPIPGHYTGKINSANALGGPKLAEQTVADALGIPINYYIQTNFTGLKNMVDAVGGLDIVVKDELKDSEYPCPGNESKSCGFDLKPGNYHMDGATVLEYTRCRKGTCGNDFGRAARQQEVIEKLEKKVGQPSVYLNLKVDAALLTTVRANTKTDMSANNLLELARAMHKPTKTIKFVYSTSTGGLLTSSGGSDLAPIGGDFSQIQAKAKNIFAQP